MPLDELADEVSQPAIGGEDANGDVSTAARRLTQEARQTLSFAGRGVSDVTEDFAAAAKQLPPGQLVKDEYFTLFEAVGALEIMDPKMDSSYVPPGDSTEPEFDVCRGLTAPEVLWIMDELLRLIIVWHDGYPLSQTVFTSLHVDRLLSPDNRQPYNLSYGEAPGHGWTTEEQLVHIVLRAYCIALMKSCALVLHPIQSQNFYEEEDFVTHLFGRELLPNVGADDATNMIDEATSLVAETELGDADSQALFARLQFARTYVTLLVDDLDDWTRLIAILGDVARTHNLSQSLPDAFSDKVQRQLATSTPPRPMVPISWEEAHQRWVRLCEDVVEAERLTSFNICQSPHGLRRAIWSFAYREPQPNTFARAYLQSILFGSERITEGLTFFDLLLTDMRDLVLAGDSLADPDSFQVEMPSDPRHKCSRVLEAFMDKAFDEYMNIYRMLCQNRCRIRRTFTHSVVIIDRLETEAMRIDEELNTIAPGIMLNEPDGHLPSYLNPLTSWTRYYKLLIMSWTIQLGLETDIYLPHELFMMYWYLMVLIQKRCIVLEHSERFLIERMKTMSPTRNARQCTEALASQEWLARLHEQAEVTMLLSLALWQLTGTLMAVGVIEHPKQDYAQEQLLYDARMKPYLGIVNDPIPTLNDYKAAQLAIQSIAETCLNVDSAITRAKGHIASLKKVTPEQAKYVGTEEQWKREMKQMETTCVAIVVQSSQLRRIADKHGKQSAGPGDSLKGLMTVSIPPSGSRYHSWWVVPQIKATKM